MEDTYNLLGHALRKVVSVIAAVQGRSPAEIAGEAGASILNSSSLKTALDLNWDNPVERQNALSIILNSLDYVELRRVAVVHNLHVIAGMSQVRPIQAGMESNSQTG